MKGKLYLIPSPLGESKLEQILPLDVLSIIQNLSHFIVEDVRTARRYLGKVKPKTPIQEMIFWELNEHTAPDGIGKLLAPLHQGKDVGLMSEAGLPAVADPGSLLVRKAHENEITVVPLVGPSSLFLALMASGLSGQNFAFVGYIPVKKEERLKRIKQLEERALREKQTQIFMETPYRNQYLLEDILAVCAPNTRLSISCELTTPNEWIHTKKISDWKKKLPDIQKKPVVFAIGS